MAENNGINTENVEIDVLPTLGNSGKTQEIEDGAREIAGNVQEIEDGAREIAGNMQEIESDAREIAGNVQEIESDVREINETVREKSENMVNADEYDAPEVREITEKEEKNDKKQRKGGKYVAKEILSWVLTFVFAVLLALIINTYVIRISRVSGNSMYQTLTDGQNVWISRLPYMFSEYKQGDIIVFDHEQVHRNLLVEIQESLKYNAITYKFFNASANHKYYIKRIIGVPGDTVRIELDGVYVNDVKLTEDYVNPAETPKYGTWIGQTWTVGEGELFVLGDNRNHSSDSRSFGVITQNSVLGKVVKS